MKDIKEVDTKELKAVTKELNDSGLLEKKIKIVGAKVENILKEFSDAVESLPEDTDIPASIATFYNDLYADEIDEDSNEDADGDEVDEVDEVDVDEASEEEEDEADETDAEGEAAEEDEAEADAEDEADEADEEDIEPPAPVVKEKAAKKAPVIKDVAPKKPTLGVMKRATINPKMSLTSKVKNILNFAGQKYKQTTYFPLDCETIRVLETNVGLYPSEVLAAIQQDKKAVKKIEKFSPEAILREINKIKSAYSYIVGSIKDTKEESKLRHIMTALVAGKEVPKEVAHISTVKIAKRALLAYMDVVGIDYSVLKDVRKELVVAASVKEKPAPKPKAETPAPVVKEKAAAKPKAEVKEKAKKPSK